MLHRVTPARRAPKLAQRLLIASAMGQLISFVCVRADHQWGAGDSGQVHPLDERLAWCPDASLDAHEHHDWRACDDAPLATVATLAAYLGTVESAVS